ncbi:MAG: tRNA (adenosine(37)-N6)-threonylcarbamoyltransferase complex ATPase subunit type 1 TsaE [Sphingobacteriia bacterium]|nr:tRNA (adenosine(37)-N6)-threonylcarbamoyltransferase complex ATPase subunit type 1 TsaE [Sphingobacteriia bacterium]
MPTFEIQSLRQTKELAQELSLLVKQNDILALYGDLGVGKTAFSRFFIQFLTQTQEDIPSPTFTLLQTYSAPDFLIYHFDLYRLEKSTDVYELGIEDAFTDGVSLIEWPEKMSGILPSAHCLNIRISVKGKKRYFSFDTTDESWKERIKRWKPHLS